MSESACGEDGRAESVTSKASSKGVMGKWASAFSRKKSPADAAPAQPAEPLPPSNAGGDGDEAGATEIEVHDNHAFAVQEADLYISGLAFCTHQYIGIYACCSHVSARRVQVTVTAFRVSIYRLISMYNRSDSDCDCITPFLTPSTVNSHVCRL